MLLGAHGRVAIRNDRFIPGPTSEPTPIVAAASARRQATTRTARGELARLQRTGAISTALYQHYLGTLTAAEASARRLRGTRAAELDAVLANLHAIAVAGALTAGRLPALFLTLERNRTWWTTGPLLSSGQRVEFAGSELVWEYYDGQGIELQELGSFGKADGLYTAGRRQYPRMLQLLGELIPLAAQRGGGIAWEYYFRFGGGLPPWTSAMSQATALEALARAYRVTRNPYYLAVGRRALPILGSAPPLGVSVATGRGRRYLLYSFAPGAAVINGFLQTLIGLHDYAHTSGDPTAASLFAAGDAEARAEVPSYDTGAWSLYEPGQEDTLSYHTLVTGFLHQLCQRVHAVVYCTAAAHFDLYLKTPPALRLVSASARAGRPASVRFRVSKLSHVGIVLTDGARTVFLTSASFSYGVHSFAIPALTRPGGYSIRLAATDLAGNFNRITGSLQVAR